MKTYKSYAKVNIFLKITGMRGDYHEILSRFMRVDSLYDELRFISKDSDDFEIRGEFSCLISQNTIYKAYEALLQYTKSIELKEFMKNHAVEVKKNIPAFAGLGGGSSNSAIYLKMCNEILNLGLTLDELASIGLKVGADVPFFVYGYDSANVSGIGEVVEKFDEPLLKFDTYTPKVEISTPKVYVSYRENFYNPIDEDEVKYYTSVKSKDVLKAKIPQELNDLFAPALKEYKELKQHQKDGYFFSGSGSSFFKPLKGN